MEIWKLGEMSHTCMRDGKFSKKYVDESRNHFLYYRIRIPYAEDI